MLVTESQDERKRIIWTYHDQERAHGGYRVVFKKIQQNYFWQNMRSSIQSVVGQITQF